MLPLPRPVSRRQSSVAETNIPMYGTITPDPAFPQDNSHPPDDPTSARPWESMASNVVKLNPARIRSYINRLPLFTRGVTLIIIILWFFSLFLKWLPEWGSLIPTQISIWAAYRLNTFPIVHSSTLQALFSLAVLVPLLERFESEHGTLVSLALFAGPFATLPGLLYILIDHVIFRKDDAVRGASIWVFLLLACEAVKQYKTNPSFEIGPYKIPTWTSTLIAVLLVNFLIPGTSLLAHLCAALIGYGFELAYLKFLIPPEKALRFLEAKLNLLGRLPHYISVDQKTYGRYGVLDAADRAEASASARNFMSGSTQRLG